MKYHQKTDIVDGIIAEKEANKEYEVNPDCKSIRVYRCWDSSAEIKDDHTARSQEYSKVAAATAEMMSAAWSASQTS